jgi:protein SCO1/2
MKPCRTRRVSLFPLYSLFALFSLLLSYPLQAEEDIRVVATIKPVHSILAGLMEGTGGPELLIGDDSLPQAYMPSREDLRRMSDADLLFWVGPELETGLAGAVAALDSGPRIIELLSHKGLKVLPSRSLPDQRDPFFWLDNRNVMIILDDMTRLLQELDPRRTHLYERNRRSVMTRLARIDREYEYGYRGMKAGLGVQYYDTLQYFEQAYALKILDRVAPSPGYPPEAAALLKVRERLTSGEAICLLTERGYPAQHLELLSNPGQVNHGVLNSLGFGLAAGPDLYFELMNHNTDEIKRCLNADMETAEAARNQAVEDAGIVPAGIASGQFLLTDHLGRLVSKETMRGKYQLVYFGYTFCPDICPTSLQIMFQAFDLLGKEAELIQPYFITIDPDRDTVGVLKDYVQYYDDRLIGVTGSVDMIDRVAAQFKAKYEKVIEDDKDPSYYLMDHTASLYLLDPQGRFITKFAHGIEPDVLAKALLTHIGGAVSSVDSR